MVMAKFKGVVENQDFKNKLIRQTLYKENVVNCLWPFIIINTHFIYMKPKFKW